MFTQQFPDALPTYHDDMLIVKLRAAPVPVVTEAVGAAAVAFASPGLSRLSMYERAGLIKRVVPLDNPASARVLVGAMTPMAALSLPVAPLAEAESSPNAGVNILELQKGTDLSQLQMALAQDSSVDFVSRVPVRYLLARTRKSAASKPRNGPVGASSTIAAVPPPAHTMWNLKKILWSEARAAGLDSAAGDPRGRS